jgi:hypothetical protein
MAREISAFPEMEGETIRPGRRVKLSPCVPEPILAAFRQREGRTCPRVELDPQNAEAAQLVAVLSSEQTRPIADAWVQANVRDLPGDEPRRILNRVVRALHDPRITPAFSPQKNEAN